MLPNINARTICQVVDTFFQQKLSSYKPYKSDPDYNTAVLNHISDKGVSELQTLLEQAYNHLQESHKDPFEGLNNEPFFPFYRSLQLPLTPYQENSLTYLLNLKQNILDTVIFQKSFENNHLFLPTGIKLEEEAESSFSNTPRSTYPLVEATDPHFRHRIINS